MLAPDLPGHGFTDPMPPRAISLPAMARALGGLLRQLAFDPVSSSAIPPARRFSCACASTARSRPNCSSASTARLLPFEGMAGQLFPPIAKLLFLNPFAPRLFAWSADRDAVARLLRGTGLVDRPRGIDLYARLIRRSGHVAGALGMMANWDLEALARDCRS